MAQVSTLTKRIEQAALLWRNAYSEVIGQIDGQVISEANAVSIGTAAEQALEGLTTEFVAAQTDLENEEDRQLVAVSAVQQVEEIMKGLRRLTEAAQWAAALNGLSTRAMSEVTTTWLPVYENAIAEDRTAADHLAGCIAAACRIVTAEAAGSRPITYGSQQLRPISLHGGWNSATGQHSAYCGCRHRTSKLSI